MVVITAELKIRKVVGAYQVREPEDARICSQLTSVNMNTMIILFLVYLKILSLAQTIQYQVI